MRRHVAATLATLILASSPQTVGLAHATVQGPLEGFRYVYVVPPTYQSGAVDVQGFGRSLADKFAKDPSWVLLSALPDLGRLDAARANETVVVTLDHTWSDVPFSKNRVVLRFHNLAGEIVGVFEGTSGMGMTVSGDISRAINGAFKKVQQARPRFVASRVVDLGARFAESPRFEMDEASLRAYLDDNRSRLNAPEGIWTAGKGDYRLGIVRDPQLSTRYIAFILESQGPLWRPKMVKATLEETAHPTIFSARYFLRDHTEVGTTATVENAVLSFPLEVEGQKEVVTFLRNYPGGSTTGRPEAESASSTGTGFVIAPSLVVTCFHVVRDATRLEIVFESSKDASPLELALKDEANDLAVLRVLPSATSGYRRLTPLGLADSASVRLGEDIYTIGYPLGDLLGESAKVTTGVVSALEGINGDARTLQISAPVQPGNSGGPLLNGKGLVAGVVVASLSAKALYASIGVMPQNVNFAVRSDYVRTLLRQVATDQPATEVTGAIADRAGQIDIVRRSVGQVRAYR